MNKPHEIKRPCWVKDDGRHSYCYVFSNQTVKVRQDDVQQMKRPKFYQASDIADHTFLNEAASRKTFTATMSAQGST